MLVNKDKLQEVRRSLEDDNVIVEGVFTKLLQNYMEGLDDIIIELNNLVALVENGDIDKVSNQELEQVTLKLPLLMYQLGGDIERIGLKIDVASAVRSKIENSTTLDSTGTVAEKKAKAEIEVFYEELMEKAYKRLYKQIDRKLDYADKIYNSIKKVLSLRIMELEVFRKDNAKNNYNKEYNEI
ncbi:MAG: hypothetical protein ACRDBY_14130 [Cetobacterium sp.]